MLSHVDVEAGQFPNENLWIQLVITIQGQETIHNICTIAQLRAHVGPVGAKFMFTAGELQGILQCLDEDFFSSADANGHYKTTGLFACLS